MRALLIIALLVCLAILLGWISFSDYGDTAAINFDKQEAREDTRETADEVEEAIDEAAEDIERGLDPDEDDDDADGVDDVDVEVNIDRDRPAVPR